MPSNDRAKYRAKTFPGVANAMVDQWGPLLQNCHMNNKYLPAIPNADQFPFPELNPRLHTDVVNAFNFRLMKREKPFDGKDPLKDQVILDGF